MKTRVTLIALWVVLSVAGRLAWAADPPRWAVPQSPQWQVQLSSAFDTANDFQIGVKVIIEVVGANHTAWDGPTSVRVQRVAALTVYLAQHCLRSALITSNRSNPTPPLPPITQKQVYIIDAFDNPAPTIASITAAGAAPICHFSAGTVETGEC